MGFVGPDDNWSRTGIQKWSLKLYVFNMGQQKAQQKGSSSYQCQRHTQLPTFQTKCTCVYLTACISSLNVQVTWGFSLNYLLSSNVTPTCVFYPIPTHAHNNITRHVDPFPFSFLCNIKTCNDLKFKSKSFWTKQEANTSCNVVRSKLHSTLRVSQLFINFNFCIYDRSNTDSNAKTQLLAYGKVCKFAWPVPHSHSSLSQIALALLCIFAYTIRVVDLTLILH